MQERIQQFYENVKSPDRAIVRHHQSGDLFLMRNPNEAFGPIYWQDIPTTREEFDDYLNNQSSDHLAEDGEWLWAEMAAGRAQPL